jgi:hypothetical protein
MKEDWIYQQYVKELVQKKYEPLSVDILIQRGKCCGSRCKNCPYEPKHIKGSTNVTNKS